MLSDTNPTVVLPLLFFVVRDEVTQDRQENTQMKNIYDALRTVTLANGEEVSPEEYEARIGRTGWEDQDLGGESLFGNSDADWWQW